MVLQGSSTAAVAASPGNSLKGNFSGLALDLLNQTSRHAALSLQTGIVIVFGVQEPLFFKPVNLSHRTFFLT